VAVHLHAGPTAPPFKCHAARRLSLPLPKFKKIRYLHTVSNQHTRVYSQQATMQIPLILQYRTDQWCR